MSVNVHCLVCARSHVVIPCTCFFFFLMIRRPPRSTLFPYRRSSDLERVHERLRRVLDIGNAWPPPGPPGRRPDLHFGDRKSTRLNSSHSQISYAVFCLKKKKKNKHSIQPRRSQQRRLGIHVVTISWY